MTMHESD